MVGRTAPASTLVTAGLAHPDGPLLGLKLDREAALQHPRLSEFWQVSDVILENDPLVRGHVYGRQVPARPDCCAKAKDRPGQVVGHLARSVLFLGLRGGPGLLGRGPAAPGSALAAAGRAPA
ncbi:hypothetical protein [Streptomyces sp. NPDC059909]|uniref:hypothetical protein n=1 Tax=Streptomyces sp. NPDC059909 TaxID=3346998 RepID=UPI00365E318D